MRYSSTDSVGWNATKFSTPPNVGPATFTASGIDLSEVFSPMKGKPGSLRLGVQK
jgi:hypothetical protein